MVARYNADLANNLGNLASRVATVVGSKCGGIGPAPSPSSPLAAVAAGVVADAVDARGSGWRRREALDATWRLIRETNAYLEANEPWKATPGPGVDAVLGDALEVLRIVAVLASPALVRTLSRDCGAASASADRLLTCECPRGWRGAATREDCRSRRGRRCSLG